MELKFNWNSYNGIVGSGDYYKEPSEMACKRFIWLWASNWYHMWSGNEILFRKVTTGTLKAVWWWCVDYGEKVHALGNSRRPFALSNIEIRSSRIYRWVREKRRSRRTAASDKTCRSPFTNFTHSNVSDRTNIVILTLQNTEKAEQVHTCFAFCKLR